MYSFENIGIFFNNQEIIAQNATIKTQNSVIQHSPIGSRNSKGIPNGPVTTSISINYIPKVLSDSLISTIINENVRFKGNLSFNDVITPTIIKIGNISGTFYFDNYNLSIDPESTVSASVSFISYSPISGFNQPSGITSIASSTEDISHSLTTSIVDSNGVQNNIPVYNINYSFSRELEPIYVIGSKEPIQLLINQTSRKVSFVFDELYYVDFSGKLINDMIDGFDYIKLEGYSSLYDVITDGSSGSSGSSGYSGVSGIQNIKLDITEMEVIAISEEVNNNDIMRIKVECEKTI